MWSTIFFVGTILYWGGGEGALIFEGGDYLRTADLLTHISYSLNWGVLGLINGDARSLDYSSYTGPVSGLYRSPTRVTNEYDCLCELTTIF